MLKQGIPLTDREQKEADKAINIPEFHTTKIVRKDGKVTREFVRGKRFKTIADEINERNKKAVQGDLFSEVKE